MPKKNLVRKKVQQRKREYSYCSFIIAIIKIKKKKRDCENKRDRIIRKENESRKRINKEENIKRIYDFDL